MDESAYMAQKLKTASDPTTSTEELRRLANFDGLDPGIYHALARNPALPADAIEKLIQRGCFSSVIRNSGMALIVFADPALPERMATWLEKLRDASENAKEGELSYEFVRYRWQDVVVALSQPGLPEWVIQMGRSYKRLSDGGWRLGALWEPLSRNASIPTATLFALGSAILIVGELWRHGEFEKGRIEKHPFLNRVDLPQAFWLEVLICGIQRTVPMNGIDLTSVLDRMAQPYAAIFRLEDGRGVFSPKKWASIVSRDARILSLMDAGYLDNVEVQIATICRMGIMDPTWKIPEAIAKRAMEPEIVQKAVETCWSTELWELYGWNAEQIVDRICQNHDVPFLNSLRDLLLEALYDSHPAETVNNSSHSLLGILRQIHRVVPTLTREAEFAEELSQIPTVAGMIALAEFADRMEVAMNTPNPVGWIVRFSVEGNLVDWEGDDDFLPLETNQIDFRIQSTRQGTDGEHIPEFLITSEKRPWIQNLIARHDAVKTVESQADLMRDLYQQAPWR